MMGPVEAGYEAVRMFAYGANMSPRVLARRGIAARASEAAHLPDFRLVFDQPGIPLIEPAFADIEPAPGQVVWGVLHTIGAGDAARLDRFETRDYRTIEVQVVGRTSGTVTARAYRAARPVRGIRPSRRYLQVLSEGARSFDLPEAYRRALEAHESTHIPIVSSLGRRAITAFEWLQKRGVQPDRFVRWLRGRSEDEP